MFCSFCDRIARTLFSPVELSISTVTAVFGAPVVIYMMVQGKREKEIGYGRGKEYDLYFCRRRECRLS